MDEQVGEQDHATEGDAVARDRIDEPGPRSLHELQDAFRELPAMDAVRWRRERAEADAILGDDAVGRSPRPPGRRRCRW